VKNITKERKKITSFRGTNLENKLEKNACQVIFVNKMKSLKGVLGPIYCGIQ
jgi:hypothetical protein